MSYLLDTHALWQYATDGSGMRPEVKNRLDTAPIADLRVLDLSFFELACHLAAGRIQVPSPLETLRQLEMAFPVIRSDAEVAWQSTAMEWPKRGGKGQHLDPVDRAIFAAARIHGRLTVVTADAEMHHFAPDFGLTVLW